MTKASMNHLFALERYSRFGTRKKYKHHFLAK